MEFARKVENGCLIDIHLAPRSSRNKIVGIFNGRLKIAIAAPPVDGKANSALIELLAEELDIPKRSISIVRGQLAKEKCLLIEGNYPDLEHKLKKLLE